MRLSLGGWLVDLLVSPRAIETATHARYAAFEVSSPGLADLTIRVEFLDGASGGAPQHSLLDAPLVVSGDHLVFDPSGAGGTISLARKEASLRHCSANPLGDLEYFLRVAVAVLAFRDRALLVHGAAVVVSGRTHLFIGQSGSGKSTVVSFSPPGTALSDDLVLLREDAGSWTAYGTPFWNWETGHRSAQASSARLGGIYKLVKAPEIKLVSLSTALGAAELVANCPVVNNVEELIPDLLARCHRLAAAVPVKNLLFRKDATFWRLLEPEATNP